MKLRLKGNSIRLRLTRSEVAQLAEEGRVEEFVEFGNGDARFMYSIGTVNGSEVTASFVDGEICVSLPEDAVHEWAGSDAVTIASDETAPLRIIVEKDFACLTTRPGEDESDMFPNPAEAACGS